MKSSQFKLSLLALAVGLSASAGTFAETVPANPVSNDDAVAAQISNQNQLETTTADQLGAMNQHRQQMQHGNGPAAAHPELISEQERADFRSKMQAAQSMEERQALRAEMRSTVQERARAAGIELPDRAAMGMRGGRPDRAMMGGHGVSR